MIITPHQHGISVLGRVAGAAAIVASCGSLALLIFARLNRTRHDPAAAVSAAKITDLSPMREVQNTR
jgi:hypothetical protein